MMRYYKTSLQLDETRVHNDYSVIGSEFCDFLATDLTFKLINCFDKAKLLEKMTYKKITSVLQRAKKCKCSKGEWELIKMNPSQIEVLEKLELLPVAEKPVKKKPGRPKKNTI